MARTTYPHTNDGLEGARLTPHAPGAANLRQGEHGAQREQQPAESGPEGGVARLHASGQSRVISGHLEQNRVRSGARPRWRAAAARRRGSRCEGVGRPRASGRLHTGEARELHGTARRTHGVRASRGSRAGACPVPWWQCLGCGRGATELASTGTATLTLLSLSRPGSLHSPPPSSLSSAPRHLLPRTPPPPRGRASAPEESRPERAAGSARRPWTRSALSACPPPAHAVNELITKVVEN